MFDDLVAWFGAKIDAVIAWARELVIAAFEALFGLLKDAAIWVIDGIGDAIVSVLGSISVPSGISSGLGSIFAQMPASVLWLAGELEVGQCLAVIGAAYAVRLIRIVATLFQWS